jgi:phosphatidylinositol alpha-1,6-mannosyltransferase
MVARRRLQHSVMFTGSVAWDDVPSYTDAGDVFAMPCRTRLFGLEPEAWGIVFLEAQACGLPVVIGRSGGAPETLSGASRGRVVGSDAAELVESLVALLRDASRGVIPRDATAVWTWDGAYRALEPLLRLVSSQSSA